MPECLPSGLLIKQIHDCLEKKANNALRANGVTMMQVNVLMELQEAPEKQLAMKELERRFQIAQSTVAGIISRLERKGFVEDVRDAADKRIKLVHITEAGEHCCAEASSQKKEAEDAIHQGFSAEDRVILSILLERVLENVK